MLERGDQNWLRRFRNIVRDVPSFALWDRPLPSNVIPSFIFHKAVPAEFEEVLCYLKTNGYRTLKINEYYDYLIGKRRDADRKVILTFDDGLRNNWSVAYPILKRMGMKAVFYINPGMVSEDGMLGPTLEDVWAGKISEEELTAYEEKKPFTSWSEARDMEASGVIDVESHGWRHRICFIENRIIDFQRPDKLGRPLYTWLFTAVDTNFDDYLWGCPVYPYRPRLAARRFLDDAGLRKACIDYVRSHGGTNFFSRKYWRKELHGVVGDYRTHHRLETAFELPDEQELAIRNSLVDSKKRIEEELGKKCEHFAYPWHASGRLSLLWLRELEIKTVFRKMSGWRMPTVGGDLFSLSRVEGYWIKSLPGKGRAGVGNKLLKRLAKLSNLS
ncbi:MAG: polysaccharide deacetylase family protein [Patescibacteria group bacterium]|jgi:hypothetical protein